MDVKLAQLTKVESILQIVKESGFGRLSESTELNLLQERCKNLIGDPSQAQAKKDAFPEASSKTHESDGKDTVLYAPPINKSELRELKDARMQIIHKWMTKGSPNTERETTQWIDSMKLHEPLPKVIRDDADIDEDDLGLLDMLHKFDAINYAPLHRALDEIPMGRLPMSNQLCDSRCPYRTHVDIRFLPNINELQKKSGFNGLVPIPRRSQSEIHFNLDGTLDARTKFGRRCNVTEVPYFLLKNSV